MNRGLEGESYIVTPSPVPVDPLVAWFFVGVLVVSAGAAMILGVGVGYMAGHKAATAAIHAEAE